MDILKLPTIQQNILTASIIADGEITKLYKGSRRKNNSYREHFGASQLAYRKWKQSLLPDLFYITLNSNTMRSSSIPLFTQLYSHFYDKNGKKQIPIELLPLCSSPYFLAILYMDDGSLSITKRINHIKRKIYLTPTIMLALQNYPREQLEILRIHIKQTFNLDFNYIKVSNGHSYMLKINPVNQTYTFLNMVKPITKNCPSMFYKTDWKWRFNKEKLSLTQKYPSYEILSSSSERVSHIRLKK